MKRSVLAVFAVTALGCGSVPYQKALEARVLAPRSGERLAIDHALVVLDASASIDRDTLFPEAKALAEGFVAGMPAGRYSAGSIAFGGSSIDAAPLAPFDRARLRDHASGISYLGSYTPLPDALARARRELQDREGRVALVLFSDGRPTDRGRRQGPEATLEEARKIVEGHVGEVCIHAVQLGDDPKGAELLNRLSRLSPCGSFRRRTNVSTIASLYDFQREVFLGAAPRQPEPELPPVAAPPPDADGDGVMDRDDQCPATPRGAKVDRRGCWSIRGAHFAFDSYAIQPEYKAQLDDVARVLKDNPDVRIRVDGHTDSRGAEIYNEQLSEQRARAVVEYLVATGIARDRLSVRGFGES